MDIEVDSFDIIVDAFSKAHERMRLARENALSNLRELSLDDTQNMTADYS